MDRLRSKILLTTLGCVVFQVSRYAGIVALFELCSSAYRADMHKHSLRWVIVGALLLWAPLPSFAGNSDAIAVIVNKAATVTKVTRDELRPIFQTKKDTFPDGTPARPFNLPESIGVRQGFDAAVLGLDPDRVARFWIDRKIRGGERPPQTAPSAAVMLKVVSKTPGAVGYIEANAVDASVKVIARIIDGQVVAP
jgi:ABC-type phosphate transport system substrate-binding protein